MPILEYTKWQNFKTVLIKAQIACENSGYNPTDHFTDASKMVVIGSDAKHEVSCPFKDFSYLMCNNTTYKAREISMKTLKIIRRIVLILLIFMVGTCSLCFLSYKLIMDPPSFFKQFDDEVEVKAFLLENLTPYSTSRDEAIEFMEDHLLRGEKCGSLRDATVTVQHCLSFDCPTVTDETPHTVMYCFVRAGGLLEYNIDLFFERDKLSDIKTELFWTGFP